MRNSAFSVLLFLLLIFAAKQSVSAHTSQNDSDRINRLVELCKVWGKVKYFHPSLGYRTEIDWDKSLIEAIPKVRKAKDTDEYKLSLQNMFDVLKDPLTRISKDSEAANVTGNGKTLAYTKTADGILLITIGDYFALTSAESQQKLKEINAEVANSRAIVLDLRSDQPIGDYGNAIFNIYFGGIERSINSETLSTPGERRRVYYGYENFSSSASGQYRTGFFTDNSSSLIPLRTAKDIPSVFILNKNAGSFRSTVALQKSGKSLVVLDGKDISAGKTIKLKLSNGLTAQIRTHESIFGDGTDGSLQADLITTENVVENALELARNFKPSRVKRQKLPVTALSLREKPYTKMNYPSPEYRLLAAFRLWNAIEHFFPYKDLMEKDWEKTLQEFIPRFEKAKDELEYTFTVAEMMTYISDSHAYLNSSVYNQYIGTGYPPIRVRMIENKPVITAFTDEKPAKSAGAELGDEIVRVDGEDAQKRLKRYAKYISASTPQSKMDKATLQFMNGEPKSSVMLTLRKSDGKEVEVKLERRYEDFTTLYHRERTGEVLRMLPGNIGYADLDRLTFSMVDEMFEKFKNTKAIIFDMRGYPNGTAWTIAARLTNKQSTAALFETPIVGHSLPDDEAFAKFFQKIQPTPPGKTIYKGKTVMLIDERSASQAEHTGLLLRAANGTKFIGSPSTGVNGEITTFTVPGAITIGFTGQSVRFPDGKQLQRIGLVPDLKIKPTIDGIRNQKDEVLETAVNFINGI
ncbi:MAG: hypothetical protein HKN25_06060 [Pyrinomonadaceae bacterium]|nr:hypothetical protein [Pyrinomonadaceae bacterium]